MEELRYERYKYRLKRDIKESDIYGRFEWVNLPNFFISAAGTKDNNEHPLARFGTLVPEKSST
jgi:hypothetical protein